MVVEVRIQSLEDAKQGRPIHESLTEHNVVRADGFIVGILEAGTTGGKTSLAFIVKHGDKNVVAECTADQFEMIIGAVRGARERFGS